MAGFEVIVRPVVFPNIRPAPPRLLPPPDDPTQGIAVLSGSGGGLIDLPHNWSVSVSRQRPQAETKRQVDKERVYQMDPNGNINRDNFVDLERLKKLRLDSQDGKSSTMASFADPSPAANVQTVETNLTKLAPGASGPWVYRPGD